MSARSREPLASAPAGGPAKGTVKRPKCPLCGKPASTDYRPFCGKRCADLDLGRWLKGAYAVPGEPVEAVPDTEED
ncbi:MAG TPA: DNA gyrase inhibitor YacG [Rhizobiales bacterium]|nr:DNA gyrase inhibitor YacG [Hyphomicrobiales bacterium]HAN63722.1 DNA gyrase inhibitor YacG [Hyphomicrobiales bacterium]HBR26669.1 DNA gyrase inhibitor YacG [Hyphomicrobiales bacterium]HCL62605.1 DNA gyrase inhibitor YacG [Hyphomicrobiales bacterium]